MSPQANNPPPASSLVELSSSFDHAPWAVIASSGAAVVCLTAEATPEEQAEIVAAGAVRLIEKGGPIEALAAAIRGATRPPTQ